MNIIKISLCIRSFFFPTLVANEYSSGSFWNFKAELHAHQMEISSGKSFFESTRMQEENKLTNNEDFFISHCL
jgi:hypothetical protein